MFQAGLKLQWMKSSQKQFWVHVGSRKIHERTHKEHSPKNILSSEKFKAEGGWFPRGWAPPAYNLMTCCRGYILRAAKGRKPFKGPCKEIPFGYWVLIGILNQDRGSEQLQYVVDLTPSGESRIRFLCWMAMPTPLATYCWVPLFFTTPHKVSANPIHSHIPTHMRKSYHLGGLSENSDFKHFTAITFRRVHDNCFELYNFGVSLLLLCPGAVNVGQSVACECTHQVLGFINRVFIMALWGEKKGINVGSQPTFSSQLPTLHCSMYTVGYLLEKLLGSYWHVIIDVLCLQQINSRPLWIVQTVVCEAPFQTVFCWNGC